MMRSQHEAVEEYHKPFLIPKTLIRSIEHLISELSKHVPDLRFKKYDDFGWKREGLAESEIEELMSVELCLTELLYCFQNHVTSRFELDLLLKKGGVIKIPCRYN